MGIGDGHRKTAGAVADGMELERFLKTYGMGEWTRGSVRMI